jgi:hypothetical protein
VTVKQAEQWRDALAHLDGSVVMVALSRHYQSSPYPVPALSDVLEEYRTEINNRLRIVEREKMAGQFMVSAEGARSSIDRIRRLLDGADPAILNDALDTVGRTGINSGQYKTMPISQWPSIVCGFVHAAITERFSQHEQD